MCNDCKRGQSTSRCASRSANVIFNWRSARWQTERCYGDKAMSTRSGEKSQYSCLREIGVYAHAATHRKRIPCPRIGQSLTKASRQETHVTGASPRHRSPQHVRSSASACEAAAHVRLAQTTGMPHCSVLPSRDSSDARNGSRRMRAATQLHARELVQSRTYRLSHTEMSARRTNGADGPLQR